MSEIKPYDIRIFVKTEYLPSESDNEAGRYVFAYTDAESRVQEVKGEGVIGEQPTLNHGESFSYTSGTMIETPVGSMQGSYQMIADDGHKFDAVIAPFTLALPGMLH